MFLFVIIDLFIISKIKFIDWIVILVFWINIFFSWCWGLWIFGVLIKIIWVVCVVKILCRWLWVVWVIGEVIVIFCFISWFIKVDFLILGCFIMLINFDLYFVGVMGIVIFVDNFILRFF